MVHLGLICKNSDAKTQVEGPWFEPCIIHSFFAILLSADEDVLRLSAKYLCLKNLKSLRVSNIMLAT